MMIFYKVVRLCASGFSKQLLYYKNLTIKNNVLKNHARESVKKSDT